MEAGECFAPLSIFSEKDRLPQVKFAKLLNAQINFDESFSKSDDDLDHEMTLRLRELKE